MRNTFFILALAASLMALDLVCFAQGTSPAVANAATSRPRDEAKADITLRRAQHPTIENYHVQATVGQMIVSGEQAEISSTTAYTYNIGAVDESTGQAPVKITSKVERFDMDRRLSASVSTSSLFGTVGILSNIQTGGMASIKDNLLVTPAFGTIDSRNRFTVDPNEKVEVKAYVIGWGEIANLFRPYVEFPERQVGAGDSWDITLPKDPWTTLEDQKLTATLVGEEKADGTNVYALSIAGSLKITTNIGKLLPLAARFFPTLTGWMDISGEATVDKVGGQILSMKLKLVSRGAPNTFVVGPVMAAGTSTVKLTLDK